MLRYGDTRRQLVGVELVTGSGAVITDLSGTLRNNVGYHLPSLVCGSEGTLGVITRVRLRLVPSFAERATALIRFDSIDDACVSAEMLRRVLPNAESIELFFADGVRLVCDAFNLPPPFTDVDGGYVLVEASDTTDPTDALGVAVAALTGVSDVAVATDSGRRAALWQYRELHTDAIARAGIPHKLDIAVPRRRRGRVRRRGTAGDRGRSARRTYDPVRPRRRGGAACQRARSVARRRRRGQRRARARTPSTADRSAPSTASAAPNAAHLSYDETELAVRRGIKAAFDPHGIMNPAVLVP